MKRAYTLVEMMVVMLIVAVLLSIAVPSFIRSRESSNTQMCVANLKRIDAAKEQWAMDNRAEVGTTITGGMPTLMSGYIREAPECEGGGSYTLNVTGTYPTCSMGGTHVISP
jgi:prepilin-type N-terminal cleavage/methylation domain-containing protein